MKTSLERRQRQRLVVKNNQQEKRGHRRCFTDPSLLIVDCGEASESSCFESTLDDIYLKDSYTGDISLPQHKHISTFQTQDTAMERTGPAAAPEQESRDEEAQTDDAAMTPATTCTTSSVDRLPTILQYVQLAAWQQVLQLLEQDPSLAKRNDIPMVVQGENSTGLLVHWLCGLVGTPVCVLDALVTLHPASLLQAEPRVGRLPVHIAVVKDAFPEVITYLCRARPQALQHKDQEGNLPLHYAAMHGSPLVIQSLLETFPQACQVPNTRDRFPIHLACSREYDAQPIPTALLEQLAQAHPPALHQVDRFGRTPLHLAANVQHPQWQVLEVLIAHAPETLFLKDKARKTPVQCAKRSHQGLKTNDLIVSSLIEATNQERRRRRLSGGAVGVSAFNQLFRSSSSTMSDSSRKSRRNSSGHKETKDFYCCYG